MEIPVLVTPVQGNKFCARTGEPFAASAEGTTRDEAILKLRAQIARHLSGGAEVVSLDLADQQHPWLPFLGSLRDEPLFDEWKEAIAERRRQIDADENAP